MSGKSVKHLTVDLNWLDDNIHVGDVIISRQRGKEIVGFSYSPDWLTQLRYPLDTELPLISGLQYTSRQSGLFGFMEDASPDRWGRALLRRAYSGHGSLMATDYLLGVDDRLRLGGFRFRLEGEYQSPPETGVPKFKVLNDFYSKIKNIIDCGRGNERDLRDVLGPGASLGGARPKLSLYSPEGNLYLAKFPNLNDHFDIPLWEAVSLYLAQECGIRTPRFNLHRLPTGQHALIIERFDRRPGRVPFASAMTLLGAQDTDPEGSHGYLEIAEVLDAEGVAPKEDLKELWLRMQYNVLTSNRDDHLRNHGFLREAGGWRLSPVYDLESDAEKANHSLSLDDTGSLEPDPEICIESAPYFGLSKDEAYQETEDMLEKIGRWQAVAERYGAKSAEIRRKAECFLQSRDNRLRP